MLAARIDATSNPSKPGTSSCRHANPNAFSGSASMSALPPPLAAIAATINPTNIQPTVQTRFTKLPNSIPTRHVRSSRPVPTVASMCGCAMMPTRPLMVSIAMTHGPMPDGVESEKRARRQRRLHPRQTADLVPAERNQHERQDDDQKPLKEIGPRRRHQPADEAVEDEHQRHDDDDFVDADGRRPSPG